jgi:cell division topological specificity factor
LDLFKLFGKSGSKNNSSKDVAKERLKLVLIQDRANISPRYLEMIKGDIVRVVSDYMIVDEEDIDIQLIRTKRDSDNEPMPAIVANIPIIKVKEKE